MVAINRAAEAIAKMGVRPAGPEAYAYAQRLFAIVQQNVATVNERWPGLAQNPNTMSVVVLSRIERSEAVLEAAREYVRKRDDGETDLSYELAQIVAHVHVYNLVNEMPEVQPELMKEQPE